MTGRGGGRRGTIGAPGQSSLMYKAEKDKLNILNMHIVQRNLNVHFENRLLISQVSIF